MFDKIMQGLEPFAVTLIIFAGASMAGWVKFSNTRAVGIAVVFFGFVFILKYIVRQVKDK